MKILNGRFAVIPHSSFLRAPDKVVTTRHAKEGEATVRASWWERSRVFEVHDLHALHHAVERGDVKAVKRELAHPRCDLGVVPKGKEPVLFEALGMSWLTRDEADVYRKFKPGAGDVLQALLDDHRVDVNAVAPGTGETVLQRAIDLDHDSAVAQVAGVARTTVAPTDLANAILKNHRRAARGLFDSGRTDIHAQLPNDGRSALTLAAEKGDLDLLRAFLAEGTGARVNEPDGRGTTALVAALRNKHADAVALLLQSGASPDLDDADGHTALWRAVDMGWSTALQTLLNFSTDRQATGVQAMRRAIERNDVECVKALAQHRGVAWSRKDGRGLTLHEEAKNAGKHDVAELLRRSRIWAMTSTADEVIGDLRNEASAERRERMLIALAIDNDQHKILALSRCADLQADIAAAVERLAGESRWPQAAALAAVLETTAWKPSAGFLRGIFVGTPADWQTQREHRRTVADMAGTALIDAMRSDDKLARDRKLAPGDTCVQAWQGEHLRALRGDRHADVKTLPSRLAAILIAAMSEGAHSDDEGTLQQVLDRLFALEGLSVREKAEVAYETLRALLYCSGQGIDDAWYSTAGDYDFIRSGDRYDREQTHYGKLIEGLIRMSETSTRMQQAAEAKRATDG